MEGAGVMYDLTDRIKTLTAVRNALWATYRGDQAGNVLNEKVLELEAQLGI